MNAAICYTCGSVIRSRTTHDFVQCRCGDIFVDGGEDYQRFGWSENANYRLITEDDDYHITLRGALHDRTADNPLGHFGLGQDVPASDD